MTSFTSIEFSAPISSASESSLPAALSIGLHMGQIPQDGKNEQYVALFFNF